MVGTLPPVTTGSPTVPLPRRPLDPSDRIRRWYENELGWPTVPAPPGQLGQHGTPGIPGAPVQLSVGLRFDVLDVPAEAGRAALRHLAAASPVALQGHRMRILVAAGSAEELPGVLHWLEWGTLPLDLTMIGEGGVLDAPSPPETGQAGLLCEPGQAGLLYARPGKTVLDEPEQAAVTRPLHEAAPRLPSPPGPAGVRSLSQGRFGAVQGAAVWVRPPEPGCEVEASLPTLSAMGGGGGAPDLVRVLSTVATQCHRLRLRHPCARPSAVPQARH
ncbi:SCO3374 family protein [Streptomyces sp. NPDC050997]|uniref:SCO3374 family protein n=1 Tax=Streptomyces sp. NPDC050997 TaxID=3155519 RepID=UPI0034377135